MNDYDIDTENGYEKTPDRITIFSNHPAYPLLLQLRETEVALAKTRGELAAWKAGYEELGAEHDKHQLVRTFFTTVLNSVKGGAK